jgi:beta-lactamase regulating signal transducer with metallopeptidase domain
MSAIAQALTAALLHFIWQGMVVAFLLWVALFALRKRSAQARYLAALAALEALAVLPVVTAVRVYTALPSSAMGTTNAAPIPADILKVAMQQAAASGRWMAALETWALPVWSFGVLVFALRAVWGCRRISAMRRRAVSASADVLARVAEIGARMGLARPALVLMTDSAGSPSVVGWFRPVILLPAATLLGLTTEQLEAVLAHELAHIRRYDSLVNAAQILVETLLFYHPAVWWTSARIREERELCCDDLAVSSCGDALCYARALARLERLRMTAPPLALGSTGGPLAYRIRRLMGAGRRHDSPSKLPGVLAVALGLVCLAVNVHWARGQEQKAVPQQVLRQPTAPASDTAENRVLVWQDVPHTQDQAQDKRRAELEALRQLSELEARLNERNPADLQPSEKAQAQMAADAAQKNEALTDYTRTLGDQIGRLTEQLAQLRQYQKEYPGTQAFERLIYDLEYSIVQWDKQLTTVHEARERLAEMQSKLSSSTQATESEQQLAEQRLREAQALLRLAEQQHQLTPKPTLSNWTVKSIDVEGLSGEARDTLFAALPVKVGSKIAGGSVDAIADAVKKFDQHLTFTVTLDGSGEAVIHIARPKI